jgi:hypothetical protein
MTHERWVRGFYWFLGANAVVWAFLIWRDAP